MPQGGSQCFPFYTYAEDGTHRRDNITDWALEQFRSHYADPSVTKWDIFHYVYAILHHPDYRTRYAANLRRELPRIPLASATSTCHPEAPSVGAEGPMQIAGRINAADESIGPSARKKRGPQDDMANLTPVPSPVRGLEVFSAFVKAGRRLAEIHVHYEQRDDAYFRNCDATKKGTAEAVPFIFSVFSVTRCPFGDVGSGGRGRPPHILTPSLLLHP